MAEYNPYRKSMSPEEFAMKQMLMEQQQSNQMQNYLGRLQYNQGQKDEEIKQRFQDVPANPRARFSSSLVSDDTYGPALSAYVGGVSVQPAIAQVNQQFEQRDAAIANLRGLYNNISRLAPDEDVVAKELEPYQQKMQSYAKDRDRYAYQKIALDAQEFAAKLNSNRTGLGAAKKNYEARAAQDEFLRKQLQEGKITAEDYNLALAIADQDYAKQGGVGKGENNVYNTYRPIMPTYVDEIEIMNKAIQGWNSNQVAGASAGLNISGQIIGTKKVNGVEGFVIRNTRKGTEEFIERGEVMDALAPVLRNDSKLQDYFRWQAKVVDYKTGDSQIVNWAKRTTMSLDEQIKQTQDNLKIAQNARNLSAKDKEVNQLKIKDMQDKLEYLTQNKTTFEQVLEAGDINNIRQMRQEKLVDKFNNDLVNLGTAKTDFSKVDVTEDISASEDFVYAAGLKQKQALGENVYKQNGQLLAEPRFKDAAGYEQVKDTYDKTLQEKRKVIAEAFGQGTMLNEPPEKALEALRKLKAAEVGEQSGELAGFYVGMGKDGKKIYRAPNGAVIDGSKIEQWANEMESIASKKYYAEVRYKRAEALAVEAIKDDPKLMQEYQAYKAEMAKFGTNPNFENDGESLFSSQSVIKTKYRNLLQKLDIAKYLDANTSLESVSQSYLDILGKDGKTDYGIAAADKKSIAEYLGAKVGVNVSEGNDIVLNTEDALNFTGLKVQVEGGNYNTDTPTDFKTAIESLGVQTGTQIRIGVSQVGYEQLLGDVRLVIPVTYKDTKGKITNKTLYINTDRNDGIWTKPIEALKNTPAMIVKRNIIKAKAEAHLGGDVKDTYENAIPIYEYGDKVRISNDGKSIYINFQGQPIRFDHEKGYRQLEAIEKAKQKQQQPK